MTTTPTSNLGTFLAANPDVERLYDNVQGTVPAVGLSAVKMAVWNTIEDFYVNGNARQEEVFWQMAVGVSDVDFNPFDETWLVAWVLRVWGLDRFKIIAPAQLHDLNYPSALRVGGAILSLKPASFDVTLPSDLWSNWFDTILDGVFYRLYRQPAKPWSSPQAAAFHGKSYRAGRARARDIANRGLTNKAGPWRFPYFAQGRRKQ